MIDDLERCMTLAKPMLVDFYEIWHKAFGDYKEYLPAHSSEHDDTTVANCIRAHARAELIRRFDGRKGYKVLNVSRLTLLLYQNKLVFRLKKVDVGGHHRNVQTGQQQRFDDQLQLPGIPPKATRLTSGYQPDYAGQYIERIVISRPIGRSIEWVAQVNLEGDGVASWDDITPPRLPGTGRVDFRARRR